MLATLLIWLYIFALSWVYGIFCIHWLGVVFKLDQEKPPSIPLISMVGLYLLITITGFLSLIIPIGWVTNLIF